MYDVVWPRGRRTEPIGRYASRLQTLDGKRIGFLWDYRYRGDEIFPVIEQEARKRFPGSAFFNWEVFGNTHGGDEHQVLKALPDKLKELSIDAVVSGIGA